MMPETDIHWQPNVDAMVVAHRYHAHSWTTMEREQGTHYPSVNEQVKVVRAVSMLSAVGVVEIAVMWNLS